MQQAVSPCLNVSTFAAFHHGTRFRHFGLAAGSEWECPAKAALVLLPPSQEAVQITSLVLPDPTLLPSPQPPATTPTRPPSSPCCQLLLWLLPLPPSMCSSSCRGWRWCLTTTPCTPRPPRAWSIACLCARPIGMPRDQSDTHCRSSIGVGVGESVGVGV